MQEDIIRLATALGQALQHKGWMMASAESCTGGGVAFAATEIAGSSAWFDRSFVTYTNQAKQEMLDVTTVSLEKHGAVSEAVVREMTAGALQNSRASIAVALSGIAGPGGGSEEKPVGTVWIAWKTKDGVFDIAKEFHFSGDRQTVRILAIREALTGLLAYSK